MDGPQVRCEGQYLPGPMFGPYSFINVNGGKEEEVNDGGHSRRNLVEVAIVVEILQHLNRECTASQRKVRIGIISPYSAQIAELKRRVERKYENSDSLIVKVKSIDLCREEEDIIIVSTVRSTSSGSDDFFSANVDLTSSRHCLWILGNEKALRRRNSVWEKLILVAKSSNCYFNAHENKNLEKVIVEVKKELDQLDDLLIGDSVLFKNMKWKVLFSDNFRRSFLKLKSLEMKKLVLFLLSKLSNGWRPKGGRVDISCESSPHVLKKFKVRELYIVCSIEKEMDEGFWCQVINVCDAVPLMGMKMLVRILDNIFKVYCDDYIKLCKVKCIEGDLVVPATWLSSSDIVKCKSPCDAAAEKASSDIFSDSCDVNMEAYDTVSLMKFYSFSSGAVSHLLFGCDGKSAGLPFKLTKQQKNIILFDRSTFILGRSGTGRTSVLITKLIRNEQLCHLAVEGHHERKSSPSGDVLWRCGVKDRGQETNVVVLRQIFVTVSSKLCYAIKQDLSQLESFVCGRKSSVIGSTTQLSDIDGNTQFSNIPNTFLDLPTELYPLVITFHKFLMMLNGTVGISYFERFPYVRQQCYGKTGISRSVALQTFLRTKEVNYEKFVSSYWPHLNAQHTRKLDASKVFNEIMSVIKGGLQALEACDRILSRQDYVSLSNCQGSLLNEQTREIVYEIFTEYEKKKVANGEFDLADLVIDLHYRLRNGGYNGHQMDFVYIDEVQELSMSQIELFKYICRNVDDGFSFSGDTAQTISRGIDFRFEDIRCLFYKQFVLGLTCGKRNRRKERGCISDIFYLSQNFRTHAGVLKLAQSVLELIYHFFPFSVDVLNPETSIIMGRAPVLLTSMNDKHLIKVLFQKCTNDEMKFVGLGAEQAILVRDDGVRNEIWDYVGKQALVLTILECKGLEFQDVFLYGFFDSSPMKNEWRVIYGYMKEQNLLDSASCTSFPSFSAEKHAVLCYELKQLYVAITRARCRLWIVESNSEAARPMFECWKRLGVVEEKPLDASFVEQVQVASSREEWQSRGIQFFHENNYERARFCFERSGDSYWEKYAKASQLRAAAVHMDGLDDVMFYQQLKEAAEIFDSIGEAELAARCFFELKENERAGIPKITQLFSQQSQESVKEQAAESSKGQEEGGYV